MVDPQNRKHLLRVGWMTNSNYENLTPLSTWNVERLVQNQEFWCFLLNFPEASGELKAHTLNNVLGTIPGMIDWYDSCPLRLVCCGTSLYAMLVRCDCRPPPTPTDKTSDPRILHHPFQDHGLPLPQRRRAWQNNHPVVTRFKGIGPMLPILEGGCCVYPFVSGLHRLLWQHCIFLLGLGGQNLHPTSLSTLLPQLFNMLTIPI